MSAGFVYILLNPSFPDQVKIGLTEGKSELRARVLQSTGVPTPFIVLYDELVNDCQAVEWCLHEQFADYRVAKDREFFRVPPKEAIRALQAEAAKSKVTRPLDRVSILEDLRRKYSNALKPEITAVEIVQLPDVTFLEVARRKYPQGRDEIIEREDLGYIVDDEPTFPPNRPIAENARRFVEEFDEYSIVMTGMPLFTEEAENRIAEEWQRPGGKLDKLRDRQP
jgi:hypothetical protein